MVQTGRHRDYFLPVTAEGTVIDADEHAEPPSVRTAVTSLALLIVALVAVVGNAKTVSGVDPARGGRGARLAGESYSGR